MKTTILTTVSVIALMGAVSAFAETNKTQVELNSEAATSGDIKEDAKEAWKDMKKDVSNAYDDIKATLIGDENMPFVINSSRTANGMIGHPVHNEKHESVAKVTDIILDKSGKAMMVIVADGAFIGTGKKAAFDYGAITRIDKDGDVIMPLTEENINNAATFSYNRDESSDEVRVIPDNGYSVQKLLDGYLVNQENENVANIENISFRNGSANHLIVGFDKMLGMGGEKAALPFSEATIITDGDKLNFQLSAQRARQFEAFKKSVTK